MSEPKEVIGKFKPFKKAWTLVICDSCVCYRYKLKASGEYSIQSLFSQIQRSVTKKGRVV